MARIVVGVDGSPASEAALRWAAAEARSLGATLSVVHAYLAPLAFAATEQDAATMDPELHDASAAWLAGFVAAGGADLDGIDVMQVPRPRPGSERAAGHRRGCGPAGGR